MHQANLFPAFEGPEHENLHTKGKECVCNPYFRVETNGDVEILSVRHQPLTEANKANPPKWLTEEGFSLSNAETLDILGAEVIE
jgi:hypothetical protein